MSLIRITAIAVRDSPCHHARLGRAGWLVQSATVESGLANRSNSRRGDSRRHHWRNLRASWITAAI